MTPDERALLSRFLQDLGQARGGLKDAEASSLIDQAMRTNPDAAYLLVQHAILSDQALHAAQAEISRLQAQGARQAQPGGGFFGGGGGPWGQQAAPPPQPPMAAPIGQGLFGAGPAQPGGFGSFLRSAGTTAAGVAGGAFLFDALGGLFGGHHGFGGGGFGGGWGGGGYGGPGVENVTINEYGDQGGDGPGYDDGGGAYDDGGYDDGGVS